MCPLCMLAREPSRSLALRRHQQFKSTTELIVQSFISWRSQIQTARRDTNESTIGSYSVCPNGQSVHPVAPSLRPFCGTMQKHVNRPWNETDFHGL
jgi:hypothetical protein